MTRCGGTSRSVACRYDATRPTVGSSTGFARETMTPAPDPSPVASSARNRLVGVVTDVQVDKVMAQVEMQCGPHRVVSLISREAVGDMGLKPGVLAVAMIKSTNVVVEVPDIAIHRPDSENEDSSTD
jgi:molybdopterin-binding protein